MPCLKKCCFCVNLRVGGIIIGITSAALALFSLIPSILSLVYHVNLAQVVTHLVEEYNKDSNQSKSYLIYWGTVSTLLSSEASPLPPPEHESVIWLAGVMFVFFILTIVLLILYFIVSLLLILGVYRGSRWLLLPWLLLTLLFALAYLTGICLSTWLFGFSFESGFLLLFSLLELGVLLYIWVCVLSIFQILEDDNLATHNWELKPRFTKHYDGVPTHEH